MDIPLIRIWELADFLEQEGHQSVPPKNGKLGISIYEDEVGSVTILIPGIISRPSIGIETPEDFFRELQKEIEQHFPKIINLIFQDGGNVPIPPEFKEWCKKHDIVPKMVSCESIKNQLTTDTRQTFGDLIEEL
jgi:hypothetical protein